MKRLLYISESYIDETDAPATVLDIVSRSQIKNAKLAITGALLFTGSYFAQIVEGPMGSVDKLMVSLNSDPRHGNIKVIEQTPIVFRKFPKWNMAYSGPSQFVSRHVTRLLLPITPAEQRRATDWLTELAYELSRDLSD